jgi:hypothetical protein
VRKSQGVSQGEEKRLATVLLPSSLSALSLDLFLPRKRNTRPGRGIIVELRTASGKGLQE